MNRRVTVAILTKGEFERVTSIARFLRRCGVRPTLFVNVHTDAREKERYAASGHKVILLNNEFQFIEPIVEQASAHVQTEFMWFLSNDEIPSPAAIRQVATTIDNRGPVRGIGVARRWLLHVDDSVRIGITPIIGADYQWRIFPPAEVQFTDELGTPGHAVPESRLALDDPIYHLDWLLNSLDERKRKLRHYNDMKPGQWEHEWQYFLPEEVPDVIIEEVPKRDRSVLRVVDEILRAEDSSVTQRSRDRRDWWHFHENG